jgi:hypothetical protein
MQLPCDYRWHQRDSRTAPRHFWGDGGDYFGLVSFREKGPRVDEYDCPNQSRKRDLSEFYLSTPVAGSDSRSSKLPQGRQNQESRKPQGLSELIGYLEKHQVEIIDYQRRQRSGKVIGSGRIEKGCDQVIGHRQKKKGMSWSKTGSRSLGILKVAELNDRWRELWFANEAANDPNINRIHPVMALAS